MQSKQRLLTDFSSLIPFVQSLDKLEDRLWTAPIQENKWSIRDIVAHLMLWDQYFLEEAVAKLAGGEPVTVRHLDYDDFNRQAVEYAKTKTKQEIIDSTVHYRNELIRCLNLIPEQEYITEHPDGDGNPFSVYTYLADFIWHDNHHLGQIKRFLEAAQLKE